MPAASAGVAGDPLDGVDRDPPLAMVAVCDCGETDDDDDDEDEDEEGGVALVVEKLSLFVLGASARAAEDDAKSTSGRAPNPMAWRAEAGGAARAPNTGGEGTTTCTTGTTGTTTGTIRGPRSVRSRPVPPPRTTPLLVLLPLPLLLLSRLTPAPVPFASPA